MKAQNKIKELEEELKNTQLSSKDANQLWRLKRFHANVVNVQVCSGCKKVFDRLLEDFQHVV